MIAGMAHTEPAALDGPHPPPTAAAAGSLASTHTRLAAAADDLARLVLGSIVVLIAAIGFLFWRTSWGAVDATASDTAIAAALLLAPAPTWIVWMLAGTTDDQASPGQRRRGIRVHFPSTGHRRALIRFAIHPLSAPGWLWLSAIAYLLALGPISWLLAFFAAAVTITGLGSIVLLALGRRALHDLILGSDVTYIEAPA